MTIPRDEGRESSVKARLNFNVIPGNDAVDT